MDHVYGISEEMIKMLEDYMASKNKEEKEEDEYEDIEKLSDFKYFTKNLLGLHDHRISSDKIDLRKADKNKFKVELIDICNMCEDDVLCFPPRWANESKFRKIINNDRAKRKTLRHCSF